MARTFVGDRSKLNPHVIEKIQTLSDDFWVLAEFTVSRNVDLLLIRPMGTEPAVVILAEVKGVKGRLRGSTNGPWQQEMSPGEWADIEPPNSADINYYFQAVNTVNALIEWLHNNAPVIGQGSNYPWSDIRVWPDLLIFTPVQETAHLLPVAPDNKFGMWFTDVDKWLAHVESWRPRIGPALTHEDVDSLVSYLGLVPLVEGQHVPLPEFAWEEEPDLQSTLQRMKGLEQRVQRMETLLADLARVLTPARPRGGGLL